MIEIPGMVVYSTNQVLKWHWRKRARIVDQQHADVRWLLAGKTKPDLPCSVLLTRVVSGRAQAYDDDNLAGSFKAVRDAIAKWLGVDDKHSAIVCYRYAQRTRQARDAVQIEFGEPGSGAQLMLGEMARPVEKPEPPVPF